MEKWLLVLLIVGGTSLVFIICFPIDFYLYRRRKRQARERNKFPNLEPNASTRAGQCHANVEVRDAIPSVWREDIRRKTNAKGGFAKVVGMIRKKQQEERLAQQMVEISTTFSSSFSQHQSEAAVLAQTQKLIQANNAFPGPKTVFLPGSEINIEAETPNPPTKDTVKLPLCLDKPLPKIDPKTPVYLSAVWKENEGLNDTHAKTYNKGALDSLAKGTESIISKSDKQIAISEDTATSTTTEEPKITFVKSEKKIYIGNDTKNADNQRCSNQEITFFKSRSDNESFPITPRVHKNRITKVSKLGSKCPSNSSLVSDSEGSPITPRIHKGRFTKVSKLGSRYTSDSSIVYQGLGDQLSHSDSSSDDTLTEPSVNALN